MNRPYIEDFTTHQPRVIYDQKRGSQSLLWDANGNLSQMVDCKTGSASINFWDEENRIRLAVNPKFAGYYGYDANGERVYKLTGSTQYDDLNGSNPSFGIIIDGLTVYPSPYIVLTEKQYTKHYYIGSEKIATMIGDGGILLKTNHLSNEQRSLIKDGFCRTFEPTAFQYDKTPNIDIQGMHTYQLEYECGCIEQVDLYLKSIYPMLEPMMKTWQNSNGCKNEIYYTHSNHLGSASWITDDNGKPIQYIHYAPYGELIANQQTIGYDERFKFTGKERDAETGYDYFGARFYDHRKGFWNSVDPLADKNISNSPYMFCSGNPIMLVDPDGRDDEWIWDGETATRTHVNNGTDFVKVNGMLITDYDYSPANVENIDMLESILPYYYKQAGVNQSVGCVFYRRAGTALTELFDDRLMGVVIDESGALDAILNTANNIINTFSHEAYHKNEPEENLMINELRAIEAQMNHSSWNGTTSEFKEGVKGRAINTIMQEINKQIIVNGNVSPYMFQPYIPSINLKEELLGW